MDPNFCEMQYELLVSNPRSTIEVMPAESLITSSRHHQVTFNFSCEHIYKHWVMWQDSEEYQFLGQLEYPATTESLRYEVQWINNRQKLILRAVVFKGLENLLDVSYLERQKLCQVAVDSAWEILADNSTPRGNRQRHRVRVDLDLMWVHDVATDEISYAEWMSHQAVEAAMVPATEASIESLQSQTVGENCGSCVVCMEDFEAAGVVLTMPCSHIFHGECIQTWLRTSHFCPVCRYQMPTD